MTSLECRQARTAVERHPGSEISPVELGLNPEEICTKLENGSYDAEFHGEQHIKSPRKSPWGKIFRGQNSKWPPKM